jgi:hypothetical protein
MMTERMQDEILDPEMIEDLFGPGFGPRTDDKGKIDGNPLIGHRRVHFFNDRILVDLRNAVTLMDGSKTKTITFEEPGESDLEAMDGIKGEIAKVRELLISCAGILPESVRAMKAQDYLLCAEVIGSFLQTGRITTG